MAGLLDFQMPGMDTPEGQGLLSAAFSLMQAKKMPGQKGAFAGALGDAGQQYMQATNSSRDQMQRRKYLDAQMEAQQMQLEAARQRQAQEQKNRQLLRDAFSPTSPLGALQGGGGPTNANAAKIGARQPYNPLSILEGGGDMSALEQGMKLNSALNPQPKYETVAAGSSLFKMGPNGPELAMTAPSAPKEKSLPAAIQEYEYARRQGYQGTFDQWNKETKKAGATNIGMPKIDIKMGDSVAGQVGPMLKDSRIAVGGAVKMFDAADRIEKALASNKVSAGPFSSQMQTAKQLAQKIGGGNDESIRQTQQVIRSLAQMSVEARKQLQGQGQVTESESKAVAKADAGDLDSLTTGELQDLVTLTKRAAHFSAKGHQELLDTMSSNDGTRGATPFYRVPGMDTLLKHQPKLPQIGGGGGVDALVDKYRSKK